VANAVKEQLELGNLTQETIDKHAKRVLRNKFELGLFEDPYGNLEDALELCASDEYKAQAFGMTTIEDVYRARTAEMNAMEIQLQTESTVLLKNDNILPLKAEQKVYVAGTSKDTVAMDKESHCRVCDGGGQHGRRRRDYCPCDRDGRRDGTAVEDAADARKRPVVLCYDGGRFQRRLIAYAGGQQRGGAVPDL